ncbi:hypothetical protein [Actinomadura algeriensis]|uniref:HEAT repeat protein n=1 Tax=Actinomadura algeriensis TaxID=1679523 RepID=A0ABR9JJ36_9ACTN|nr:hypothetical protein [Actinomadura algeriensis]MBE1530561.1 hypothetical protein [Actinomadura algeriensis]
MTRDPDMERRIDECGRRGLLGALTAKLLFASAADGDADARDAVVEIARTPGHRRCGAARARIADWWDRTRDPVLRQAVLDTGAVAVANPARLRTLALHDRLGECGIWEADWAPGLLTDPDPDVRGRASDACLNASGTLLHFLWAACHRDSPLRDLLLRNDRTPPARFLDVLWAEWLETPDEALEEALSRWAVPSDDPRHAPLSVIALKTDPESMRAPDHHDALRDALALGDHPLCLKAAETIAHLGEPGLVDELCERALENPKLAGLCKERALAPSDPVRRGVFFLLTGQPAQYRALDPDGHGLALAYAAASKAERARVREAMLTAGELDLVRVITGDRARLSSMTDDEARYLAERLAHRHEWDELWTLVQDAPIANAVELIRLFDRWAPRGDDERRHFGALRATDPATVRAGLEALRSERRSANPHARLDVPGDPGMMSFSPGSPALAVRAGKNAVVVFDPSNGRITGRYEFDRPVKHLLHLGNGVLIVVERGRGRWGSDRLTRCANGSAEPLPATGGGPVSGEIVSLVAAGDGFAASTRAGYLLRGTAEDVTEVRRIATYRDDYLYADIVAAHRESGRIAVHGLHGLTVIDAATGDVAARRIGRLTYRAAFADADTLVITRPRASGDQLTRTSLPHGRLGLNFPLPDGWTLGPVALPVTGQVVVADGRGSLDFLDGERLTSVHRYTAPPDRVPARRLAASPREDFLAVGHRDGVELFDVRAGRVPDVARKPVADLVSRDLELVDAALADPATGGAARTALELVRACLDHRFRFDVEVGGTVRRAGGDHDIGL